MVFTKYLKLSLPFALFASLASRLYVSWDGYLYLSSAKALFSPEFSTHYHWLREPLYPFYLWLIHTFFGNSDVFFSLFNLIILAIACSFASWSFQFGPRLFLVFITIVFVSSISVGMAGSILQQTLLSALVLTLLPLIGLTSFLTANQSIRRLSWQHLTILIGGLGSLLSFLFLPVILSVLLANLVLFFAYKGHKETKRLADDLRKRQNRNFFVSTIKATIFILLPFICWSFLKLNFAQDTYGEFKPFASLSIVKDQFASFNATKIQIAGGLASLTPDVDGMSFRKSEIRTFGLGLADTLQLERCGYYNDGYPKAIKYVAGYISPSCKANVFWKFFISIQPISLFFFRFFLLISPLVFLFYLRKRDLRFAVLYLPIFVTWALYFVLGLGISRYMYAIWPATVFYSLTLFTNRIGIVRKSVTTVSREK